MARLHHGVEDGQRTFAQSIELRARARVSLQGRGENLAAFAAGTLEPLRIVAALRDHAVQHARVLADIQRRKMETEGIDPPQQASHLE